MRLWPFSGKPRPEHYLGEYTEPSFRGAIVMLVISIVMVALIWIAYSWALNEPNVPNPPETLGRVTGLIAALAIR